MKAILAGSLVFLGSIIKASDFNLKLNPDEIYEANWGTHEGMKRTDFTVIGEFLNVGVEQRYYSASWVPYYP